MLKLIISSLLLFSCSSLTPDKEIKAHLNSEIKKIASSDMKCSADKLSVTEMHERTFIVKGCGKKKDYLAKCPITQNFKDHFKRCEFYTKVK